jgi:hypothetical protein
VIKARKNEINETKMLKNSIKREIYGAYEIFETKPIKKYIV